MQPRNAREALGVTGWCARGNRAILAAMLCLRHLLAVVLAGAMAFGCDESSPTPADAPPADAAPDAPAAPCSPADDPDGDGISNRFEGAGDTDHDDTPDARDPDSDDDGIPDAFEASAGRPRGCLTPPIDSDMDGTPDFQDVDSNGDTIPDADEAAPSPAQRPASTPARDCLQGAVGVRASAVTAWTCHPFDTDGDGAPDYADPDVDDDHIQNPLEIMPGTARAAADTDGDGLADFRDIDSDDDTIADLHEGALDRDGDGLANFRDRDSDGDSPERSTANSDALEAGDADPRTPPVECALELDARTLDLASRRPDGVPDYLDTDSDNDGLSDAEEVLAETNRCDPDSDDDGQLDSVEVAWCRASMRAHCATDRAVRVPDTEPWIALPYNGAPALRELEFTATHRAADVFLLVDTSARGDGALAALQGAVTATRAGAIDAVRDASPDAQVGLGHFEDFVASSPMGAPYGAMNDRPFWPLCPGAPGTTGCRPGWGITLQPTSRAGDVQAAAQALTPGDGGDGPNAQVEALYQTLTGEGLFTGDASIACADSPGRPPCWVAPYRCPDGTRGAACFRRGALPVVVLVTGADFHEGAPMAPGLTPWSPYAGIAPRPHGFADLADALGASGARVVSLNTHPTARCEGPPMSRVPGDPCFDLHAVARAAGAVDRGGRELVYDLARPPTASGVVDALTAALRALTRDVPFDVTLSPRADASTPAEVDATRFVRARTPSCQAGSSPCWTPPPGLPAAAAVGRTDAMTFVRVVPGTRVRFTVTLRNEAVYEGDDEMTVFKLYLDALGDRALLDTREVNVVVPAAQRGL